METKALALTVQLKNELISFAMHLANEIVTSPTSKRNSTPTSPPSRLTTPSSPHPPTPEELSQKLRSFSNSAPGKDRLEYRHLCLLDPKCEILACMFKHCFEAKDVPAHWKMATTILICKKNSTADPSNFHPIALMSCLYKLLMSIIARRMTNHAIAHDLLPPEQKSTCPCEGCYEHAFLLQSIVNDARCQPRPLSVAWLDIKNAFGSFPHAALPTTLTDIGFLSDLVDLIGNAYTRAITEIVTPLRDTRNPHSLHSETGLPPECHPVQPNHGAHPMPMQNHCC